MAVVQTCPHSRDATAAPTGMSKLALSSGTADRVPWVVWSSACAAAWSQVAQWMDAGVMSPLWAPSCSTDTVGASSPVNLKLAQVCLHKLWLGCDCSIKMHPTGEHRQPELPRKCLSYTCNQEQAAGIISNSPYFWLIILHILQI